MLDDCTASAPVVPAGLFYIWSDSTPATFAASLHARIDNFREGSGHRANYSMPTIVAVASVVLMTIKLLITYLRLTCFRHSSDAWRVSDGQIKSKSASGAAVKFVKYNRQLNHIEGQSATSNGRRVRI